MFFSFQFRERTCLKPKPELWRRLAKYYLGQLHPAIVCRVGSWPFDFDDSTRVPIVCDANLSLFNYYYFWYVSLFYKATFADQLPPIRDIGMEQIYPARQVPVPVMKGLHELQDKGSMSLFRYSHPHEFSMQSTTPHPQDLAINPTTAQRMTTGRLWRNGVGYVVPVSVVEDFPYWLGGWECLLCQQKTVVSIKNHCFECKKVFCYTCIQNKNGSNFVRETDPDTGSEIDRCTSCSVRLGNQSQPTNRLSKQLLASSRTSVTPYWEGTGSSTSRKCRAEENVVFGLRKMQPQQKSDVDGQDGCSLEE